MVRKPEANPRDDGQERHRRLSVPGKRAKRRDAQSRLEKLAQYMRGWMGYYAISKTFRETRRMDYWMRRRIRCCYWKQWKTNASRVRKLMALGVSRHNAVIIGVTKLGYWKMSKTPGVNQALSNRYLRDQGLLSLVELWSRVHYPDTFR